MPPQPGTHCKRGHPFTDDNVLRQGKAARGGRMCRACQRDRDRAYQLRRYHSTDPATRRTVSIKIARHALQQRARRLDRAKESRPRIDLAFIDQIIREELNGTL